MTIEDTLKRIAEASERIADALEKIEAPSVERKETKKPEPAAKKAPAKSKTKEPDAEEAPKLDAVVKALQALMERDGREAAVELLSKYDAKRASDLDPSVRAEFIQAAS
jgi:hypothetical protein